MNDFPPRSGAEPADSKPSEGDGFYSVFLRATAGLALIGLDGKIVLANDSCARILGLDRSSILGIKLKEILADGYREPVQKLLNDLLTSSLDEFKLDVEFLDTSEAQHFCELSVSLVLDKSRSPLHFIAQFQDITARRNAERLLQEQGGFLRQILDINPSLIFAKDRQGRFTLVNRALAEVYGTSVEELVGKTDADFNSDPEEVNHFRKDDLEVMDSLQEKRIPEEVVTDSKGKTRVLQTVKRPIIGADGKSDQILGVATDITERKQAEEDQRKLESQVLLNQKLESLGLLAGGIAHDFNNLLMGILGNAGLALMDLPEESPARRRVVQVELAAKRAAELTHQLLAYSGKGRFDIRPVNLSSVVQEMGSLLGTVISKSARVTYDTPESIALIEADPSQVRQIIMNLITNASDALQGRKGTISVRTEEVEVDEKMLNEDRYEGTLTTGRYVLLTVEDNGCGMSTETAARIFDPFFTTKFTGRGLGLAAAVGIVRSHHGAIRVKTQEGQGTAFEVLFPIAKSQSQIYELKDTVSGPQLKSGEGRVLVVEDESDVREICMSILERHGYKALGAKDGSDALNILRSGKEHIDCVILDLTMPGMSGEETLKQIRQDTKSLPVILSSGFSEAYGTNSLSRTDYFDFVQKPYEASQLIQSLQAALNASH